MLARSLADSEGQKFAGFATRALTVFLCASFLDGQKFLQRHSSNFKSGAQSKNQRPGFGSDFLRVTVRHSIRPSANTRLPQRLRVFTTVAQGENGAKNGVGVSKGDQLLRCISYDAEVMLLVESVSGKREIFAV